MEELSHRTLCTADVFKIIFGFSAKSTSAHLEYCLVDLPLETAVLDLLQDLLVVLG